MKSTPHSLLDQHGLPAEPHSVAEEDYISRLHLCVQNRHYGVSGATSATKACRHTIQGYLELPIRKLVSRVTYKEALQGMPVEYGSHRP